MEDDAAVRLELEWTRPRSTPSVEAVRKRYARMSKKLVANAEASRTLSRLPEEWSAIEYDMGDQRKLVIAYFLAGDGSVFCFFRMHFDPQCRHRPVRTLKTLATSLRHYGQGLIPWQFYDVAFALEADFRLSGSALRAGNKLTIFEWRLRRLFIWHVGLADVILKKTSVEAWAVDFLNGFKALRGPKFAVADNGTIVTQHRWRYPFGHYEEIGRQCFRYLPGCRHLQDRNQIVLWVYNYRRESDVEKLKQGFKTGIDRM